MWCRSPSTILGQAPYVIRGIEYGIPPECHFGLALSDDNDLALTIIYYFYHRRMRND
jgi:hypothetical protein